jgi:hypothetical protein
MNKTNVVLFFLIIICLVILIIIIFLTIKTQIIPLGTRRTSSDWVLRFLMQLSLLAISWLFDLTKWSKLTCFLSQIQNQSFFPNKYWLLWVEIDFSIWLALYFSMSLAFCALVLILLFRAEYTASSLCVFNICHIVISNLFFLSLHIFFISSMLF